MMCRILKNIDAGLQSKGSYSIPFSAIADGHPSGVYNVTLFFNDKPKQTKIIRNIDKALNAFCSKMIQFVYIKTNRSRLLVLYIVQVIVTLT